MAIDAKTVTVPAVTRKPARSAEATSSRGAILGRDELLTKLNALVAGAQAGTGSSTIVSGEAGVGKTAVLDVTSTSVPDGVDVRRVVGVPTEADLPFAALHALVVQSNQDREAVLVDPVLASATGVDPSAPAPNALAVGGALLRHLSSLGGQRPLLIVIDDLQWIDPSSAAAFLFVARRLLADSVTMIFGLRTEDGVAGPDLRGFDVIRLEPLDDEVSARLLRSLGVATDRLPSLVARGGGLPLLLSELAHDDHDTRAYQFERSLPVRYMDLVRSLQQRAQDLCALAALDDELHVVRIVLGAEADAALTEAEDANILRIVDGRVRFRHPLLRAAAIGVLSASRQRALHALVATALGTSTDTAAIDRCALHRAAAAVGVDEVAALALAAFADRACKRAALVEGADAYLRAAALTADSEQGWAWKLEGAYQLVYAGKTDRSLVIADELKRLTAPRRDLSARLDRMIATASQWERNATSFVTEARTDAEDLMGIDDVRAAHWYTAAASASFLAGELEQGVDDADRAIALAASAGEEIMVLEARGYRLWNLVLLADPALEDEADLFAFIDLLAESDSELGVVAAASAALMSLVQQRWDATRRAVAKARTARKLGLHLSAALLEGIEETLFFREGRWTEAVARATGRIAEDSLPAISLAWGKARTAQVTAAMGDEPTTLGLALSALESASSLGAPLVAIHAHAALGALALGLGRQERAYASLVQASELSRSMVLRETGLVLWQGDWIDCLLDLGKVPEANEALAELTEVVLRTDRAWAKGVIARGEGRLATSWESAAPKFEESIKEFVVLGMPFEVARTRFVRAQMNHRLGALSGTTAERQALVADDLVESGRIFRRLGAAGWSAQVEALAATVSGRHGAADATTVIPSPERQAPDVGTPSVSILTPAEQRVAFAVASGLTNSEVAADLYVSVKTVEFHLRSVYAKLGVRNRAGFGREFGKLTSI